MRRSKNEEEGSVFLAGVIGVGLGGCAQLEQKVMGTKYRCWLWQWKILWGFKVLSVCHESNVYLPSPCSTNSGQIPLDLEQKGLGLNPGCVSGYICEWSYTFPLISEILASCLPKSWMRKKSHGHALFPQSFFPRDFFLSKNPSGGTQVLSPDRVN